MWAKKMKTKKRLKVLKKKETIYYESLRYAVEGVTPTLTLDDYSLEGAAKRTATYSKNER